MSRRSSVVSPVSLFPDHPDARSTNYVTPEPCVPPDFAYFQSLKAWAKSKVNDDQAFEGVPKGEEEIIVLISEMDKDNFENSLEVLVSYYYGLLNDVTTHTPFYQNIIYHIKYLPCLNSYRDTTLNQLLEVGVTEFSDNEVWDHHLQQQELIDDVATDPLLPFVSNDLGETTLMHPTHGKSSLLTALCLVRLYEQRKAARKIPTITSESAGDAGAAPSPRPLFAETSL